MKFLLMICVDPTLVPPAGGATPDAWITELSKHGHREQGSELVAPSAATTVRVRNGSALATEGPFAETKEFLAGFDIIECDSREAAIEIAKLHPVAAFGAVEVRAFAAPRS